jgi:hypothetical protein
MHQRGLLLSKNTSPGCKSYQWRTGTHATAISSRYTTPDTSLKYYRSQLPPAAELAPAAPRSQPPLLLRPAASPPPQEPPNSAPARSCPTCAAAAAAAAAADSVASAARAAASIIARPLASARGTSVSAWSNSCRALWDGICTREREGNLKDSAPTLMPGCAGAPAQECVRVRAAYPCLPVLAPSSRSCRGGT